MREAFATRLGIVHLPGDARRTHVRRSPHLLFTTRRSRAVESPGSRGTRSRDTKKSKEDSHVSTRAASNWARTQVVAREYSLDIDSIRVTRLGALKLQQLKGSIIANNSKDQLRNDEEANRNLKEVTKESATPKDDWPNAP
ncbi:hypothetical protein CRG98_017627 [Punica granatum]|uniref:Uncharacterized protein n=1 Tax=Punica granatum TaxID=22663 RepID=A0A2I0K099_PUNGR|nr:hypothetical protein CRG98_017627 [Punica granatum]